MSDGNTYAFKGGSKVKGHIKNGPITYLTYSIIGEEVYKLTENGISPGFPKRIKSVFPEIPSYIDAAFTWSGDKTYFFKVLPNSFNYAYKFSILHLKNLLYRGANTGVTPTWFWTQDTQNQFLRDLQASLKISILPLCGVGMEKFISSRGTSIGGLTPSKIPQLVQGIPNL